MSGEALAIDRPEHSGLRPTALDGAIGAFLVTLVATTAVTLLQPPIVPPGPVPVLLALAALCAAFLARRRAPSLAWLAAIGGTFAAASIPIDQARTANPALLGVGPWLGFALPTSAAAIVTLAIAAAYATQLERRLNRWSVALSVGLLVWLVIACLTTVGLTVSGLARPDPDFTWIDVATAPVAGFVPFVVAVTGLGAIGDVRAAVSRARSRIQPGHGRPDGAGERAWSLAVATARELVPGQSAAEEASLAAERTRLAGDLHAVVLPSLRRAIAEAEAGGDPATVAGHLRTVDLELERLMADRWPVVLEAFGLVAALEDLAERIEADGRQAVEIDVELAGDRPPPAIERAAWRVAQVAIDNAVRHAEAASIRLTVAVAPDRVRLVVADDGRGFDATTDGVRPGARGLADASRRAAEIGGSLQVAPGAERGTIVAFGWSQTAR